MHSLLYTANIAGTPAMANDSVIPLGSIERRAGCAIDLNGDNIRLIGNGYYKVAATFSFIPSVAETVTIRLYKDGVEVPGAEAQVNTDAAATLPIVAIVRESCCDTVGQLSFRVSTSIATTTVQLLNAAVTVVKL